MKKDEHEYCVRIKTDQEKQRYLGRPGVKLTVTELHVEAPEEVTEGETADLTCKTTCSLTDPTFIWYKDGRPLTTKTIKNNQLHLQTVSSEDAGSYSCAVRGSQHLYSTAHSLRVRYPPKNVSVSISSSGRSSSAVWFSVGGGSFLFITVLICICSFHRMKKRAAGTDHSKTTQDDVLYISVIASTSRPAQAADSADSGAAEVLYTTVMIQNDEVTSTDQQGEPQYDNVTFHHHTAVTGTVTQNVEDPSMIYSTISREELEQVLKVAKEECLIWKLAELRSCAPEPPMVSKLDLGMTMRPDTIEPHTTTPKDPEACSSTLTSIQSHSLHAQTDRSESTLGEPKASTCTWTSPQSHSPPALADRSEPTLRDSEAAPQPRRPT
ncbi:hypothetical protein MHYP_G00365980 [Metynnis hypsauchen]